MKSILSRLKKIEGQIRGVQKLIEEEKPCDETIIQFLAAKSSIQSCFAAYLSENMKTCLKDEDLEKIAQLLQLITKQ